jgi:hypothetical protein
MGGQAAWRPLMAGLCARGQQGAGTRVPPTVVAYGLGMPARKTPTPQEAVTARRILLDGLARDADIFELLRTIPSSDRVSRQKQTSRLSRAAL